MEKHGDIRRYTFLTRVWSFFRKCLFSVLSFGPMPKHVAFIMDGNRRFAKNKGIEQGGGHRVGFSALTSTLQYCYEMGIDYVTIYAFSIDNFKRKPDEVQSTMRLMQEKIDELFKEESVVSEYGVRINFWGDLSLLSEPVRLAAEKAMVSTAKNTGPVLSVCMAYTSTNEIMHAVQKSCGEKICRIQEQYADGHDEDMGSILVADLEQHFYTSGCPDPDILIRTSGETRLSNFLLWQTTFTHLQNPAPLWPEFSLMHLVWAVLMYQKAYPYLKEASSTIKKMH
ncbi:dehydrodolichyl diphosphate synthase 6-like [Iris pallida]|uniref:Alkyl transferase n=1 Tax=Iris pallida TaxID=29817 RepID=A0AAX6FUB6_IRIPA|nr:dehydrodolichyl diphosphate synthase 6-like [Iris pallida]